MSSEPNSRSSAAIVARANALAASGIHTRPDVEADMLAALASGTMRVAELEDHEVDSLVQRFGVDAVVRGIERAPDESRIGNRLTEPAERPPVVVPIERERVAAMPARQRPVWAVQPTWLAAAASLALAAVGASVFLMDRREPERPSDAAVSAPAGAVTRGEARSTAPAPLPAAPAAARNHVAVVITGNDSAAAAEAEDVLRRALDGTDGLQTLGGQGLAALRQDHRAAEVAADGDFAALTSIGREYSVELFVFGQLTTAAEAQGDTYAGFAELRASMFRIAGQQASGERIFEADERGQQAAAAATERDARIRAARTAAGHAAEAVRTWVVRAVP